MNYSKGDIVLLPYPFTDLQASKVRPAIVVASEDGKYSDVFVVPVTSRTSALNSGEYVLKNWSSAGLISGELMGFVVDSVSEVIRISGSEIQPPPTVVSGGIDQECITGVINQSERLLVLLDLEKLFSHEEKALLIGG